MPNLGTQVSSTVCYPHLFTSQPTVTHNLCDLGWTHLVYLLLTMHRFSFSSWHEYPYPTAHPGILFLLRPFHLDLDLRQYSPTLGHHTEILRTLQAGVLTQQTLEWCCRVSWRDKLHSAIQFLDSMDTEWKFILVRIRNKNLCSLHITIFSTNQSFRVWYIHDYTIDTATWPMGMFVYES